VRGFYSDHVSEPTSVEQSEQIAREAARGRRQRLRRYLAVFVLVGAAAAAYAFVRSGATAAAVVGAIWLFGVVGGIVRFRVDHNFVTKGWTVDPRRHLRRRR
jgi:hypothetical protein